MADFTNEEIADFKVMRFEWKKAKKLWQIQNDARIERNAVIEKDQSEKPRLALLLKPIDDRVNAKIKEIESAKTVEDLDD